LKYRRTAARIMPMWLLCVCEFELARAHVLDYALAQRADGIGTRPAIIVVSNARRSRRKSAPASAGYRGSDLSEWPLPTDTVEKLGK
jgi:hypothetical protein